MKYWPLANVKYPASQDVKYRLHDMKYAPMAHVTDTKKPSGLCTGRWVFDLDWIRRR